MRLSSVEDEGLGEELSVVWELEPGVVCLEKAQLPALTEFDVPRTFDAFLDAVAWGSVSSADDRALQAHFPRLITSIDFLKRDRPMRLFRETLPAGDHPGYPRPYDLLIVDEAHNVAPAGRSKYSTDSMRTDATGSGNREAGTGKLRPQPPAPRLPFSSRPPVLTPRFPCPPATPRTPPVPLGIGVS